MRTGFISPALGHTYPMVVRRCIAVSAVVKGQIVEFDLSRANAGTVSATPGARDSSLSRVLNQVTAKGEAGGAWLGVATEDCAAGLATNIVLAGDVYLLAVGNPTQVDAGDALFAVSGSSNLTDLTSAGRRCQAIAVETVVTPSAKLVRCMFEGRYGWNTAAS